MKVYVDQLQENRGAHPVFRSFCHMAVTPQTDEEVLHSFAESIGLNRKWYQTHSNHPHYDLVEAKRMLAVEKGAVEVSNGDFVRLCSRYASVIVPIPIVSPITSQDIESLGADGWVLTPVPDSFNWLVRMPDSTQIELTAPEAVDESRVWTHIRYWFSTVYHLR